MSTNKQSSQAQMKDKIVAVREGIKEIFADKTKQFSNDNIIIVLDHFEYNIKSTIEAFLDGQADALLTEWKKAPNKTKSKKKKKNSKKKAAAADVSLNDTASSDVHGKYNGVAASPHTPEVKSTESSRERSRVEKPTKTAEVNGPVAHAPARMESKNENNMISNKNHTPNTKSGSQPSPHLDVTPIPKISQDVTKKPVADHQSANKSEKVKKNLYQTKPVPSDVPPKNDVTPPAEPAPSVNNYHNKLTANGRAPTTVTVPTTSTPTALTKKPDKSAESPKPPTTTFHPSPIKSVQKPANQSKPNSSSNHNNQKPMPKKKSAPKSSNGKGPQHQNPTHPVKSNENDSAVALANKKIIEKSARDLLRCQVSLSRYQTVVRDDSEASYKDVKQSFEELSNLVMDREVELMRTIDQSKATALEFISKRQATAAQLKVRTERVGQMSPGEVNELRAEIKHFVSERKHDEQISKNSRLTLNIDVLKKEIQQFGEAPEMRKPREHFSSVSESTTPTPSVTTPAAVNLVVKTAVENDVFKSVGAVPAEKIDAPQPASKVQPDPQTVPNSANNKQVTNSNDIAPSPTVGGSQDASPAESQRKTRLPERESPVSSPNEPTASIKDENQVPNTPKVEEKPSQTVPSAVSPKKRRSPKGRPKDLSIQDAKGGRGMENGAVPDWADEADPTPMPSSPASWASDGPAPLSADISSFPTKVFSNEAGNNQFSRNFERRSGSNHRRNRQNSNQSGSGQQHALKQDSELMPPPKHPDSNKYNRSRSGMRDHHQMRERSSRERPSRERSSRERPVAPVDGGYRVGMNGPAAGDAPDFQPREQHRNNYRNRDSYRGSRGRNSSYRGRGNRGNSFRGRGGGGNYNGPPHNNNNSGGGGYYRNHSGSRNGGGGNGGGNNDNYRMNHRRYNNNNNPVNGDHRPHNNNHRYEKGAGSNNKKVEPVTAPVPAQE